MNRIIYSLLSLSLITTLTLSSQQAISDSNAATYITGNQLIQWCNQHNFEQNNADWNWCVAYVEGIWSGIYFGAAIHYSESTGKGINDSQIESIINICTPENLTSVQTALVVSKYLTDHPAELNKVDVYLINEAFRQAWPCPKEKR